MSDSTRELIERIGTYVPAEFRAAFYREMLYCRSLPENDEMLRILRVLQILTLLFEQVPDRVVKERERLEKLLTGTVRQFDQSFKVGAESLAQLDRRLALLPGLTRDYHQALPAARRRDIKQLPAHAVGRDDHRIHRFSLAQELRRGLLESGQRPLALAPTRSAVEELHKVGFKDAVTIERLLQDRKQQAGLSTQQTRKRCATSQCHH